MARFGASQARVRTRPDPGLGYPPGLRVAPESGTTNDVWTATTGVSQEDPGFLQRRVALFGLAAAALGFIFLAFRAVMAVAARQYRELVHPNFLFHLLAVVALLAVWAACRGGARSPRFVRTAEAADWFLPVKPATATTRPAMLPSALQGQSLSPRPQ